MRYFFACLCVLLLSGCGGDDGPDDLQAFAASQAERRGFTAVPNQDNVSLADLDLSTEQDYAEIRLVFTDSSASDYEVIKAFDDDVKASLSEAQLFALNTETTLSGYDSGCLPEHCVIYLVALHGLQTTLVDNMLDLRSFLGEINPPAEISFVSPESYYYQQNEEGYLTLTIWSDCNGNSGVDLVQITRGGDVLVQQTLATKHSNVVC